MGQFERKRKSPSMVRQTFPCWIMEGWRVIRTEPLYCGVLSDGLYPGYSEPSSESYSSQGLVSVTYNRLTANGQKVGWQMRATRRQFIWNTLGVTLAGKFEASANANWQTEYQFQNNPNSAKYGSGIRSEQTPLLDALTQQLASFS